MVRLLTSFLTMHMVITGLCKCWAGQFMTVRIAGLLTSFLTMHVFITGLCKCWADH